MSNAVASRYAKALLELSKENNALDAVEQSAQEFRAMMETSPELVDMLESPILSRKAQSDSMAAVAQAAGFHKIFSNTLALMAEKRRLNIVSDVLNAFDDMLRLERNEEKVEVISAVALTDEQQQKIAKAAETKLGKKVLLTSSIDESLIGGLVIKIGSTMIDSSLKGKLSQLHNAMKEVG